MSALERVLGRARRGRPDQFPWTAPTWPVTVERDPPERRLGVDYDTEWSRRYLPRLLRAVVLDTVTRPALHVLATPQVRGEELLDLVEAPAIYVANHASHVDTALVLSILPPAVRHRTVVAAAADHFFDRRWKAHLWALSLAAIPIERHRLNRRSAERAADLVREGWNLLIYPEGGRTHDGWFQPMRGGAAYLATRTGRPVVPLHIEGTYRILPRGAGRLRRGPTRVTVGSTLTPAEDEPARRLEARIDAAMGALADEARSDWWAARRRARTGATPSPRGPDAAPWRRAWALGTGPRTSAERDPGRWALADD